MNRRDLLKRLGFAAPAVLTASSLALAPSSSPAPADFMFHGWRVCWHDWREIPNMDLKVGVWCAYSANRTGWQLYSAYPGACTSFFPGSAFNLTKQADQQFVTWPATTEELAQYREHALIKLKKLIEEVGPPPFDPYKDK